ncbi:MAG: M20/M25/M40 family metallo-hydrolase, partial [Desulfovibrio sp.]|nr:M20/M25/M40 family metallo-hydrolase [Desulfovibrio sp.]
MEELSQLCETIMSCEDLVFKLQQDLTKTKAMAPEQGGHGETEKCQVVENFLKELGLKHMWHVDADDARVPGGKRPNLICHLQGKSDRTLWIFSHLDVVDAGDLASWDTDPWTVTKKGDWLYGRGVEDNQQSIVSSLILAYGLKQLGLTPEHSLGLVFLADEENGNTYGLSH